MTIATETAREVTHETIATGRSQDRTPGSLIFLVLPVVLAVLRRDGAARADRRHRDPGRATLRLAADHRATAPGSDPRTTGFRAGILGTLWLMVFTALFAVPLGIAAALYLEEFADSKRWWNRLIEVNLQNLAAVPAIVYGLLAVAVDGADGLRQDRHRARRRGRAGAADPAGHHHHHARGSASGAAGDPAGVAGARRDAVADDLAADAARRPSRASRPARSSASPGRSARRRR